MDTDGLTETQAIQKAIAERCFGWTELRLFGGSGALVGTGPSGVRNQNVPQYALNMGDAWKVWVWIRERMTSMSGMDRGALIIRLSEDPVYLQSDHNSYWRWFFDKADVPLTLCRVALALLDAEEAKP